MSKTSAILGLIALIAVGGFIIFGEEKNIETNEIETENLVAENSTENSSAESSSTNTEEVSGEENTVNQTTVVTYMSSGFSPNILNINMGDTVKFINDSSGNMWVASNPHPQHTEYSDFDAQRNYTSGESYSFTFTESGTYEYHNHVNPSMRGTIVVLGDK